MKQFINILFVLLITLSFYACQKKSNSEFVVVNKITDGDTFSVTINGINEKIRLIGIDAPESKKNAKAKRDSRNNNQDLDEIVTMGKRSTEFMKSILHPGDEVKLEFDIQQRDQYGRLLAYVYLKDKRMLNRIMVEEGYAQVYTIPPNVKHQEEFLKAQRFARENNKGLWQVQ